MDGILKQYIFISLIFIVDLHGSSILTIDEQIAVIKQAPESERFKLMNKFKRQLVRMNQEEREEAIAQLKKNQNSIEERVSTQPIDIINGLERSSVEQHVEMSRVQDVEDKIEEIKDRYTPNGEHPSTPDNREPSIPNGEHPSVPDSKEPTTPNGEHPSVPDSKEPTTPNDGTPSTPDNKEPSIPNGEHPSIPNGAGLQKIEFSLPTLIEVDDFQQLSPREIEPQGGNLR